MAKKVVKEVYSGEEAVSLMNDIIQLKPESDRVQAIIAVAEIDNMLQSLLFNKFTSKKSEIFGSRKLLENFGAKVDIAFELGLIDSDFRNDCNIIREIRNKFSHESGIKSFDDKDVKLKLKGSKYTKARISRSLNEKYWDNMRPQQNFVHIAVTLIGVLKNKIDRVRV